MRQRFYIQIIVVSAMAVLLSSLYYYSVCRGLRKTNESFPGKLNQILYDTTSYDAVFVGTSRVLKNINPLQFDSLTGISSYNAGIDGANFTLIDMVTRRFIEKHRPTYVFINLDTYTMELDSSFFYYPQFLPHMQSDSMKALALIEPHLLLGKYCPFLAVSYIDDYLKGVAFHTVYDRHSSSDATFIHKGFAPIGSTDYQGKAEEYPLKFDCRKEGFKKLDLLCNYCKNKHCAVFFIMAPIYRSTIESPSNSKDFYAQLSSIEKKYDIRELNFYIDKRFSKEFFFNMTHLNQKGAALYTTVLADSFIINK